ncbi:fasciclin-like arabinogalactan protein 3 [Zingiber officinale]|uniref:FAS1 domain-containing protein n=1 Tax=Zingiber officinale TaxID=94328 RepID=A0A8J5KWL4_ZINOF|nr:fasciclin-like arabinogalactan protein 3 [Zingiber officinale]KAG6502088.1 hypothetical protein ZIOFF_041975 [Zingiber officinale]
MASNAGVLALLLLSAAAVGALAFDVKEILSPEPDFSTFTKYLTDTKVADDINSRKTITVLVLDNTAVAPLAGLSAAQLKDVLSVHVLLDYYDPDTLDRDFKNKTALITTLFQTTGRAADNNGFLNYAEKADQSMYFGSAAAGAPQDSELMKVIGARPYDLSVIQISKAIIPPGIAGGSTAAPAGGSATTSPATASPKSSGDKTTSPAVEAPKDGASNATSASPKSDPPAGSASSPAKEPVSDASSPSEDTPDDGTASAPASSDSAVAPGPASGKKASSAERTVAGAAIGLAMALALVGGL